MVYSLSVLEDVPSLRFFVRLLLDPMDVAVVLDLLLYRI